MSQPPLFILYVRDAAASTAFYAKNFGLPVAYQTPDFCVLVLGSGAQLGLWQRGAVTPAADGTPGSTELALAQPDADSLQALHTSLAARGVTILQAPEQLGFGLAFTVADPDGHHLRLFVPAEA